MLLLGKKDVVAKKLQELANKYSTLGQFVSESKKEEASSPALKGPRKNKGSKV